MATAVQTGLNMLQVGALRMPCFFASMNGALLVGEGMLRIVRSTLDHTTGPDSTKVRAKINDQVFKVIRPYADLSTKQLAISALFCCLVGTLGSEAVSAVFGKAPPIYNEVLTWLGNIRIDVDNHHPLVQLALAHLRA